MNPTVSLSSFLTFLQFHVSSLSGWGPALTLAGLTLFAVELSRRFSSSLLQPALERALPAHGPVLAPRIHQPLCVTIGVLGGYLSVQPLALAATRTGSLWHLAVSIVFISWVYAMASIGRDLASDETQPSYLDREFRPIFENLWTMGTLLLGVFGILSIWNIDITPLLASAGIVGISVGFAARDTIANFFGGIMLYADSTYTIGDYIQLEDGFEGTVRDISVRSTVLHTRDGDVVTIPNAQLHSSKIINESDPRNRRRISVSVGVAYGSDIEDVEAILLDCAERADGVLDAPSPEVRLTEFGDSALTFEVLCWVDKPANCPVVQSDLNRHIYQGFTEAGIEIPYPQREVSFSGDQSVPSSPDT